jgi:hypothetical protein
MLSFTFICSSYTCCLLHSFVHSTHVVFYIHLFILHMLYFTYTGHSFVHPTHVVFYIHGTFICSSYTCCLLHTRHIHLFILHMLSFTYTWHRFVHPTHVVFYIHGTFICSSYTCCLLHSFVHPTHVVVYIHGTFICSSYTCCLLHTRDIHLFILHMLPFTYTEHSFVHPTHVVFYIRDIHLSPVLSASVYLIRLYHTADTPLRRVVHFIDKLGPISVTWGFTLECT